MKYGGSSFTSFTLIITRWLSVSVGKDGSFINLYGIEKGQGPAINNVTIVQEKGVGQENL